MIRHSDVTPVTRACRCCGKSSDASDWYKSITTHCAQCWRDRQKAYYRETIEGRREYERGRAMAEHRVEARRRYQGTDEGKAAIARARRSYCTRFPEKRRAHIVLGNAVRDGIVVKPAACSRCCVECSEKRSLHAHHADYSKPLEVEWLCGTCHRLEHRPPPPPIPF